MPTHFLADNTPVVHFDPLLELSPFILYRRLKEGRHTHLIDARPEGGPRSLVGASSFPGESWTPTDDLPVVIFDDDGSLAIPWGRRLREAGYSQVKVLFGGLDLYELALDPQVVGEETYLRRTNAG